jgi:4-alpha-glucanotransferase
MRSIPLEQRRTAGVTVPLFSLRSERSWGIGEISDLRAFGQLAVQAGVSFLQLLPLGEISGGETSPYSALSAFGIDPMYIGVDAVADLADGRGHAALDAEERANLERAKASPRIDYASMRPLKQKALRAAFARFRETDLEPNSPRAAEFRSFVAAHASWLDDFALFRALKDRFGGEPWWTWPTALGEREANALRAAQTELGSAILEHQYLQWVAHAQWTEARSDLARLGLGLMGDLPFMVARDSADVWANRREFNNAVAVGVPPDAFDADGQDWDLPAYDWTVMRRSNFKWLRQRAHYAATLYDRFRIDHLVGFYRTYSRPRDRRVDVRGKLATGSFDPDSQAEQRAHGERVIGAMLDSARALGAELIAEDLGTVPDFVRTSLAGLGVPGYKVLVWEKDGDVFRDPRGYPEASVACFGTHDTSPVSAWWEGLSQPERRAVLALPTIREAGVLLGARYDLTVHEALATAIAGSKSRIVLFLVQDLIGSRDRINTPSTVGVHNWTYRLPALPEILRNDPYVSAHVDTISRALSRAGRT